MTSNTRLLLLALTTGIALCFGTATVLAQDAQYTTAEYNEYQKAVKEGADSLITFIKTHPDSALKQYAISEYQQLLKALLESGKHAEAVEAGKKYLAEQIREHGLTHLVVGGCSPKQHELTFMSVCQDGGMNPFLFRFISSRV